VERRSVAAVAVQLRTDPAALPTHGVAGLATLLPEETGTDPRIAGGVQGAEIVEERQQACHLCGLEPGPGEALLLEDVLHPGRVVPHHAGDIEQGAIQDPATEIGPGGLADAVDGVAAEAPLPGEEPAPLQRIAREDGGEALVTSGGRADAGCWSRSREKDHEADGQNPPLHDPSRAV
jgi:hypothetical protein